MEKIFAENRKLELQKTQFIERTEKLKLAASKIQNLEKDLAEKKEFLSAAEKKKTELALKNVELEDTAFNLENQLKSIRMRYQTINNQVDETIAEN